MTPAHSCLSPVSPQWVQTQLARCFLDRAFPGLSQSWHVQVLGCQFITQLEYYGKIFQGFPVMKQWRQRLLASRPTRWLVTGGLLPCEGEANWGMKLLYSPMPWGNSPSRWQETLPQHTARCRKGGWHTRHLRRVSHAIKPFPEAVHCHGKKRFGHRPAAVGKSKVDGRARPTSCAYANVYCMW